MLRRRKIENSKSPTALEGIPNLHTFNPWGRAEHYEHIIRDQITEATGHTFNFVLVNRYKDGNVHVEEHQDDRIAAVSFRAVRDLVFRHQEACGKNAARKIEPVKVALQQGSLLLMNWPTNVNWYHSLPVRKKMLTPRISLTFRRVIKQHKSQK
ncbi:ALKB2 demethylase, partial [Polyodon spathula]|nr:ALKB2 demethylase [Polyodon spathula]